MALQEPGLANSTRRLELLAQASAVLSDSLDYETTVRNVVELAVPDVADWCSADLVQPDGSLRNIPGVHPDPRKAALLEQLQRAYPPGASREYGVWKAIEGGGAEVVPEVTEDTIFKFARDAEHARLLRDTGIRSYMVAPLAARGRHLGALVFILTEPGRSYSEADLPLAEDLARRCAVAVENAQLLRSSEERGALLDTLFASAPVGLGFIDTELRYRRVNPALAEINGLAPEDHIGRAVPDVLPDLDPEVLAALRGVLETGRPIVDQEVSGETPAKPGRERQWLVSFYPVREEPGRISGLGMVVGEITERKRAEREHSHLLALERTARREAQTAEKRIEFLAEASALLDSSLDYEATLRNVTRLVVPKLADWCVVDMLSPEGAVERRAVAHTDPRREEDGWSQARMFPPALTDESGPGAVIRTGRPAATDAAITVPLRARGRVIGAMMMLLAEESPRSFGDEEVSLAEELAARCALAADNAALYREAQLVAEREREVARTLQSSLLPPHPPEIPGVEVAARYRAAGDGEVGGDFYDVFPSPGGWTIVMGDVCGKGADAAALTGLARHTIRTAARYERSPRRVLQVLNDTVLAERTDGRFLTAAVVHLEPVAGGARMTIACGGHPLPLILHPDGRVEEAALPGTVIGLVGTPGLRDNAATLGPGDTLVMYTDGVTESRTRDGLLGEARFRELLSEGAGDSATELADRLEMDLARLRDGESRDDVAIIAVRTPGPG